MLCVILDRALPLGEEYDETFNWVENPTMILKKVIYRPE